jgi:Na+-transporting methylmalonyl-CoA/oxaloacetate decarboxylase gamma subunit
MLIVGGPLLFLLGVVYTRAVLEIMIVFFRLMDDVTRLTETLEQSSAPPPERREKREREFEDYPPAL